MDDIFSDDDEFGAFRDRLYDVPKFDDKENSFLTAPREDLFIRGLEAPSNDDPYTKYTSKKVTVERQLDTTFVNNYSFFGLQKDNVSLNSRKSVSSPIENRAQLLEKLKREEDEEREDQDDSDVEEEEEKSATPKRKSQLRELEVDSESPKLVIHKKRRRVALSSSSDSDSDSSAEILIKSPRQKRVSKTRY